MMASDPKTFFTYMLECADGSFYSGYTTNLEKRLQAHNKGAGSKYTRSRRPVALLFSEQYETKGEAMRREAQLKKLSRGKKETLLAEKAQSQAPLPPSEGE